MHVLHACEPRPLCFRFSSTLFVCFSGFYQIWTRVPTVIWKNRKQLKILKLIYKRPCSKAMTLDILMFASSTFCLLKFQSLSWSVILPIKAAACCLFMWLLFVLIFWFYRSYRWNHTVCPFKWKLLFTVLIMLYKVVTFSTVSLPLWLSLALPPWMYFPVVLFITPCMKLILTFVSENESTEQYFFCSFSVK